MVKINFLLLLILILNSCKDNKSDIENNIVKAPLSTPTKIHEAPNNPGPVIIEEPPTIISTPITPIPMPTFYGAINGGGSGGGGGGRSGPIKESCHCDDDNPCTVDTCIKDKCIHTLDTSKTTLNSCEVDGNACTVGKCVDREGDIFCFEQNRSFIEGEFGCNDGNDCTADSCIEAYKKSDNKYQCIQEVINGLACFAESECTPGTCTDLGSGEPGDEFRIECVANPANGPKAFCPETPETISNPCKIATCTVGVGCEVVNAPAGITCNDGDVCTIGDTCNGSGVCSAGIDLVCPDDNFDDCLVPICGPTTGCGFQNATSGSPCEDGSVCTQGDTCNAMGVCGSGETVICPDDGDPCTAETCVADLGCTYPIASNGTPCIDLNACTLDNTTCQNGTCLPTAMTNFRNCAEVPDNPCTLDFCDDDTPGGCEHLDLNGPVGPTCFISGSSCGQGNFVCEEGVLTSRCELDPSTITTCRRAFMTSNFYTGDLVSAANNNAFCDPGDTNPYTPGAYVDETTPHGVKAADCLCQSGAYSQGSELECPGGGVACWKAWIADSTAASAPDPRFNMATSGVTNGIYLVNPDGTPDPTAPIAVGGWNDLVSCATPSPDPENGNNNICLDDPAIVFDPAVTWKTEMGSRLITFVDVISATNVLTNGKFYNVGNFSCVNWASSSPDEDGNIGVTAIRSSLWTDFSSNSCSSDFYLYCFEDFIAP